jgi:hypothetical protein
MTNTSSSTITLSLDTNTNTLTINNLPSDFTHNLDFFALDNMTFDTIQSILTFLKNNITPDA